MKKLWVIGIVLLVAAFIANSIGFTFAGSGSVGALVGLAISFIPMIISGVKGNKWREKSMLTRGFKLECAVIAESSEGALAEAVKPEEERNSIIAIDRSASLFTNEDGEEVMHTGTILQEGNMLRIKITKHTHDNQEQILNKLVPSDGEIDKYLRLNTRFTFSDFS